MYVHWNRNLVQGRISGVQKQRASVNAAGFWANSVASHTLNQPARSKLYNLHVGRPITYIYIYIYIYIYFFLIPLNVTICPETFSNRCVNSVSDMEENLPVKVSRQISIAGIDAVTGERR